ncbi:hypothetical protein COU74_00665 [Candidatus Peregrinibacteria bacterium CG10_big_fil_rev_8_21_14_0_10_36_19]|nr:MAG: hypothetical protein COU74_00665 [Candidatus Peregrinibacteria bacterium CG10_big_fil_rev_8_21_14_0_10_36_19]
MNPNREKIGRSQNLDLYGLNISNTKKDYIVDVDGKEYIDFLSCASSLTLGYQREDLVKAFVDQCQKVPHTCTVYTFSPIVGEYVDALLATTEIVNPKVLFGAFGSDSIESAIKSAQVFTGKKKIIAFKKAYHGGTCLSLASSGFEGLKNNLHLPDYFFHLDYPDSDLYESTLIAIEELLKSGEIAALLMETILGDGGVIYPALDFYKQIKSLLERYGALLIFDEIQSGMGRTGKFWSYEHFNIVPDLFCTAKGLGGGYVPLSACIGRGDVIDAMNNCQNAFTFSSHAASCAVGLRVIQAIYEEKVLDNVIAASKIICEEFEALKDCDLVEGVRGEGLMLGLALKSEKSLGPYIGKICLKNGVYVGYYGANNNVIRIHPALTVSEESAREGARRVVKSVLEFASDPQKYLADGNFKSFFTE